MITIYCLVDPRNNKPFYVGATEKPKIRVNGHISRAKSTLVFAMEVRAGNGLRFYPECRKTLLICDILNIGFKPHFKTLYECSQYCVQFYEKFFYDVLIAQGYTLEQEITKKYPSKTYEHTGRPKRKHLPIKNNLILIW